ncbi:hypothetical protein C8R46DRAFT_1135272 [Mycena filopes]|nr:hypothetical protein C8R46DRAFT_1138439 [Mycena filopes]KAJ7141564.1 hypothetical protein C8R46DRAFT_1135272 [Mycena filopes]
MALVAQPAHLRYTYCYVTVPSHTTTITQWGPGALSGKAIRAMGKAVLRGVDYLVISRRLSRMKAVMPCRDNDLAERPDWRQMFFDALELSRPELYPEEFRMQALRILLAQIATRQTHYLRACIAEWDTDPEDRVALLSEIIGTTLFSKRGFVDETLASSYTSAVPSNCHPWTPCVSFLLGVARSNEGALGAALDARFLEMILWVAAAQSQRHTNDNELVHECAAAFSLLSQPTSYDLSILWMDQILRFCPEGTVTSLPQAVESITSHSRWPLVECRLLEMYVGAMLQLMHSLPDIVVLDLEPQPLAKYPALLPAFDLTLILSSSSVYSYLRCLDIGAHVLQQTVDHFSRLSYPKKIATFGQMVQHLIAQSVVEGYDIGHLDSPYQGSSGHYVWNRSKGVAAPLFTPQNPHMALNIVAFLVSLTKTSEVPLIKEALLDAALLGISLFLSPSWDPLSVHGDVYRRAFFSRSRVRASYRDNTSKLLKEIRTAGLSTVIDEPNRTRTWVHFLQPLFN